MENPSAKFFRLKPGGEVRLRFGYIIKCEELVKDSNGDILEIHCSYDPDTKSGSGISTRKVKGTIHWVSAQQCIYATLHLYETLMSEANPNSIADINPESLRVIENAALEELLEYIGTQPDGVDKASDEKALFDFRDRLRVILHGEVSDSTMF